jgi:hypothetical protein
MHTTKKWRFGAEHASVQPHELMSGNQVQTVEIASLLCRHMQVRLGNGPAQISQNIALLTAPVACVLLRARTCNIYSWPLLAEDPVWRATCLWAIPVDPCGG